MCLARAYFHQLTHRQRFTLFDLIRQVIEFSVEMGIQGWPFELKQES
jgi:hypothetical protein